MTEPGIDAPDKYDPNLAIDKWLRVWEDKHLFEADGLVDAGTAGQDDARPRSCVVSMYPYPSGDLHMGHAEVYSISDVIARYLRLRGDNVLNPIGWDSFGLPAENAALKRDLDPSTWTYANIEVQAESFRRLGVSFDWRTRLHTSDADYYRWNQWLFLRLLEKGIAYRKSAPVNWCPVDKTVLANEQVVQGKCERCGSTVQQRDLTQWFFRTTQYAQRLLDDMAQLEGNWPSEILAMQRNWIGRSTGAYVDFAVEGRAEPVRVFTTRPDTIFGATFFVVAADAPLAAELCAPENRAEFEAYRDKVRTETEIDRLAADRPKTGVPLGRHALNPVTGQQIPIYAADYVLATYGTGAVMAVPAHDQRDLDFAKAMGLPVVAVLDTGEDDPATTGVATAGDGTLVNSGRFDGLAKADAIEAVTADLQERGAGERAVIYRLRDWLVSRQRYWGTPIPIIHCPSCGEVPVPDDQLPVRLPETGYELRSADGASPLESATEWAAVDCPSCGGAARRDTDTMDTFVDSSWYFLRYPDPTYTGGPFNPEGVARWFPVAEYIGGKEHATGHLMYARFMTKVLHDLGMVGFTEPFAKLTNQGQVIMNGRSMSKSLGNLVNLQEQLGLYGPDAVRVTMLFAGPPDEDIDWADVSPTGAVKWLARIWRLAGDLTTPDATDGDGELRQQTHRLVDEITTLFETRRLNVAVARLMELTSLLRKACDSGAGPADPAVHEGMSALLRMLSCFAPFTADEAWSRLGLPSSVIEHGWPEADPALVFQQTVVCAVQVAGKVRDRLTVATDITETDLRDLALNSEKIVKDLAGRAVLKVIVRAPNLVNIVPAKA
ncbi:leucine--tRNA ligase [Actinokineospora terrae]|uniref:Leucine--tRNA ligase n=1 Tax=Actinokineospora terrae TaxID=155974 RepID=A0A1H9X190_9PSEU|nr:leucine--tRNA ligase [Actinokineospora terrae]SES39900.1 leucyl-tRNA synthetase [Actinokineospora terrae]